ncbi:MAG: methylenetetrahydrofolate--tRNA-(uracil(54)-C(5))-methyltransferase (FADH(2)-oxidizing) TrmFO, partial [Candidatus Promineifilaceae bacterium]
MKKQLVVVGGGLAGSEAAWQAAESGVEVTLFEMRPVKSTPAHATDKLAELVCSNSLGSALVNKAAGVLKAELRGLGSLILSCAEETAVPAGSSLAVDRDLFADCVSKRIAKHPSITIVREEVTRLPEHPAVIASGPLTSDGLARELARLSGEPYLYFYDAVSPIVHADSINMSVAFRQSRYDQGDEEAGDYINCPLDQSEYETFVQALRDAETIALKQFEQEDPQFFEGCMPVEVLAQRGHKALAFGPLRPVGLLDPRSGRRPYAVVQLRQDNVSASLYNMVGFQTNLRWGEQRRVLRLIPGLEDAEFLRYGMMHRNTYVNAPRLLQPTLQWRARADLFFAGQITGVEGYMGNAATGLAAGINATRLLSGRAPVIFPTDTMLGALCHYVTHADAGHFQPMKA